MKIFRVDERNPVAQLAESAETAIDLRLSPNGQFVAARSAGGVVVTDIAASRRVWSLDRAISRLEFSADSQAAIVGLPDGTIVAIDLMTSREVSRFRSRFTPLLFAVQPAATNLAVADTVDFEGIEIWDWAQAKKLMAMRISDKAPLSALAWSPDSQNLAVGVGDTRCAEIWDLGEKRVLKTFEGHVRKESHRSRIIRPVPFY